MSVRFTLEKRTNKFGECPIRLSWSFGGRRYQTTMGYSVMETDWDEKNNQVKPETKNQNEQSADDINFYIKRIGLVVASIEQHFVGKEKALDTDTMKHAISDAFTFLLINFTFSKNYLAEENELPYLRTSLNPKKKEEACIPLHHSRK